MLLKGAAINFIGDSITEGVGASCPKKRYTDVLAREFGLKAANNYGISGTRIARQKNPTVNNPSFDQDLCSRYAEMDPNADAVVVFGGTNDFGHGDAPLGTFADRTPDTFTGACHYLMNGLLEMYVGKPVVILTPCTAGMRTARAAAERQRMPRRCPSIGQSCSARRNTTRCRCST